MVNRDLNYDITARDKTAAAFRQVQGNIQKTQGVVTRFLRGFGGAAIGAGIVAGLVNPLGQAAEALDEFDKLSKRARQSGLTTDFFQTLQLAAEEANFSQETLNRSILAFNKRLGELRAGTGPLVASLKFVDEELLENLKSTNNTEQALRVLADRLGDTDDASRAAAIASAAFSRAGIEMVEVLRQGSDGLDRTADKARNLGLVIDKELLANAERINNDFGVATRVLDTQFKQVLVDIAPIITTVAGAMGQFAKDLNDVRIANADPLTLSLEQLRQKLESLNNTFFVSEEEKRQVTELIGLYERANQLAAERGNLPGIRQPGDTSLGNVPIEEPIQDAAGQIERTKKAIDAIDGTKIVEVREEFERLSDVGRIVAFNLEDAFDQFLETGKLNFKSFVDSAIKDLLRLQFRQSVSGPLQALFSARPGGGFAAGGAAFGAPIGFASGGGFTVGGMGGTDRNVLSLNGAPVANVTKGERVNVSRNGGGSGTVVNVFPEAGQVAEQQTRRGPSGEEIVDIVLSSPRTSQFVGGVVEGVYGNQPETLDRF